MFKFADLIPIALSVVFVEILDTFQRISPAIINLCQIVILILTIIYLNVKIKNAKKTKNENSNDNL